MPKCSKSEAHAIDYVYGELAVSQAADFERHLTTCDSCATRVSAFKRVLHLVDEAEAELTPYAIAPRNLEMKLYRRLAEVPPDIPSLRSRLADFATGFISILREQKAVSVCLFAFAVIAVAFFVGNPFRPTPTFEVSQIDSADARIEQYRHQDIQRSMEDVIAQ